MKDLSIKIAVENHRKELLVPYMNRADQKLLAAIIQNEIISDNSIKIPLDKEVFFTPGHYLFTRSELIIEIIPDYLIADIFNIYYHSFSDITFTEIDSTNRSRFNLLIGLYDHPIKIITGKSIFYSTIYVQEICRAIVYTIMSSMDINQINSLVLQLHGKQLSKNVFNKLTLLPQPDEKELNKSEALPVLPGLENNFLFKKILAKARSRASTYVHSFSQMNEQIRNTENKDNFQIIKMFPVFLQNLELLTLLGSNSQVLSGLVEQTFDACQGFFKTLVYQSENLLTANEIHEFSNLEFVHPKLKNCLLDYATVGNYIERSNRKFAGYLDISASMRDAVKLDAGNYQDKRFSAFSYAKAVFLKFVEEGIIDSVTTFNEIICSTIHGPNEIDIMSFNSKGNTNINNVIVHQKMNVTGGSFILTDARCLITQYNPATLIIGVPGSVFRFSGEGSRFIGSDQVLIFNGAGELERWKEEQGQSPEI